MVSGYRVGGFGFKVAGLPVTGLMVDGFWFLVDEYMARFYNLKLTKHYV